MASLKTQTKRVFALSFCLLLGGCPGGGGGGGGSGSGSGSAPVAPVAPVIARDLEVVRPQPAFLLTQWINLAPFFEGLETKLNSPEYNSAASTTTTSLRSIFRIYHQNPTTTIVVVCI